MKLFIFYLFYSTSIIYIQNSPIFSMSKNTAPHVSSSLSNHALTTLTQSMLSNQKNTANDSMPPFSNTLESEEISNINIFLQGVRNGDQDLVLSYLENGMNPNIRATTDFHYGMTALMIAVGDRRINITKILLRAGADPNTSTQNKQIKGITALMIASMKGPLEIVDLIVDAGADVNSQTSGVVVGSTALTAAIGMNRVNIIKRLLERGADISIKTSGSTVKAITTLMIAAQSGNTSTLKILLDAHDIDINAKDSENKNALIYAYVSGNIDNMKLLLNSGATNDLTFVEIRKILETYLIK